MTESTIGVPPALLNAVASRSGRVTLVVGAGCSVEHPTSLHLARTYSRRVHDDLVADGVIEPGDCAEPEDLSLLASTVFARTGSQAAVVKRLPHNDFRLARANNGYLLAAALMCEGSVGIVASLNYDLAMSDALRQLDERGVDEIAGPSGLQFLGTKAIIYLHRNVNEQDEERWILRKEALDDEWRNNWESVVANRIAASPVVVFAGLGSPAAVLTETVGRVRGVVPNMLESFLADPAEKSQFAEALNLPAENHVRAYWGEFMELLARRVATESERDLTDECKRLRDANGWNDSDEQIAALCVDFGALGLLAMGRRRATWLASSRAYEPDAPNTRPLVADLVLAIGLLAVTAGISASFTSGGWVEMNSGNRRVLVLPVSGSGYRRWSQLDALLPRAGVGEISPDLVVAGGFVGPAPESWAPPADIIDGEAADDITVGYVPPRIVSTDDVRRDPDLDVWGDN